MKRILSISWALLLIGFGSVHAQLMASVDNYRDLQTRDGNPATTRTTSLRDALTNLEQHYKVSFIYPSNLVDTKVPTLKSSGRVLETDLNELLVGKQLSYRKIQNGFYAIVPVKDKSSRLFRKIESVEINSTQTSAPITLPVRTLDKLERIGWSMTTAKPLADITGKVADQAGTGIPGVSVIVKGTNRGTSTDASGNFSINAPDNAVLVFSFVGYLSQEVAVGSRSRINVTMIDDVKALSEVVVVGYGTQKRASVTGAISSVSAQEVTQLPVPSIESAIQGRVPGVSVVSNGSPGESPIVRIRGIGSISFASNPLYVIDGFPTGDLNNFDSRDIESVDVLKDASAASIYGSRAANGVIIITTKKGKADGKLHVSYDGYAGVQSAWRKLDLLNTQQYLQYGTALLQNAENDAAAAATPVRTPVDARPARFLKMDQPIYAGASQTYAQTNTDWQDAVFRNASIQQHSLQISGGNEKSRFHSSLGYFNQDGIMIGTGYKRGNFRINSEHTVNSRITFGQALAIAYSDRYAEVSAGGRTQIQNMIRMTPYMPITDPVLVGGYRGPDGSDATDPQNPVRAALQDRTNSQQLKILASAYVDINLFKGLTYRIRGGIDYVTNRDFTFQPIYNESFNARALANLSDNRNVYTSPLISNQLTYQNTFGLHNLNVTAVAERQAANSNFLNGGGTSTSNDVQQISAISPTSVGVQGGKSQNVLLSYLARVNYEYNGRYLVSASIRRDGSSKFAPGNKWGNFPSASIGWRISEEPFIKTIPAISELKLRASYGLMGFNAIGDYDWQVAVSQNTNAIIGTDRTQGVYFDKLGNTQLKWEITKMTNVGVDLGFLNNKLTMTAEYFVRNTDGLILPQPIAPSIGYTQSPVVNVGNMQNRGFELQIGYADQKGGLRYNVSANMSAIRNTVQALAPGVTALFNGNNSDFGGYDITRTAPDESIQSFYGWKVAGIFQNVADVRSSPQPGAKPGDLRFVDVNADGKIDADDRVNLGSFLPNFSYGINANLNYRNFDVTLFLQGVQGNKVYNGTKVLTQGMLRLFNAGTEVLQAWTPTNTNTDVPRAVSGDPNGNTRTSDRFLEDGSYLRLKNLSIGYTLPATLLQSSTGGSLSRVRIYVSGANLLTFTKYTGYDPEVGSRSNNTLTNGVDYGQFPQARTLTAGLQVGF